MMLSALYYHNHKTSAAGPLIFPHPLVGNRGNSIMVQCGLYKTVQEYIDMTGSLHTQISFKSLVCD